MNNEYLHIENGEINYQDNVFSGLIFRKGKDFHDFCLKKADDMRHSDLGNYDDFTKEQREELAKRWEAAKDLPDGEYDYYFNLEDKIEVFKQTIEELAKRLRINYELKVNGYTEIENRK